MYTTNTIITFFFTTSEIVGISPTDIKSTELAPLVESTCVLHLDGVPMLTKLEEPELYKIGDTSPNGMVLRKNTTTGYSSILTMEQWEYILNRKGEVLGNTLQDMIDEIPTREAMDQRAHKLSVKELEEAQMIRTAKYAIATLVRDKPSLATRERIAQIVDRCSFLDPKGTGYTELVDNGMVLTYSFAIGSGPVVSPGIRGKSDAATRPSGEREHDDMQWAMKLAADTKSIRDVSTDPSLTAPSLKLNSADPASVRAALKDIELSHEALADRQATLDTLSTAINTYMSIAQDIEISYENLLGKTTQPDDAFYASVAKLYSAMVGLDIEDFIKGKVKDTSK